VHTGNRIETKKTAQKLGEFNEQRPLKQS
jgi:hypothetical protein